MTKRAPLKLFFSYLWITLASVVYAVGFNWCYEPNRIGFGGITGVAQIVNAILPAAPIGTVVIILNVPLFLMGWKFLGGHLLLSSLYAMFISSLAIDLAVILAVAVAFGNLDSALYGVVALYLSSKVMDLVLYGLDTAKVAYIISDRHQEIAQRLIRDLDRGVTLLRGEGGWSGREKRVVMCAFKQRQIVAMKAIVRDIDPAAFLIVCDAHEVMGEGFREYKQNDL